MESFFYIFRLLQTWHHLLVYDDCGYFVVWPFMMVLFVYILSSFVAHFVLMDLEF